MEWGRSSLFPERAKHAIRIRARTVRLVGSCLSLLMVALMARAVSVVDYGAVGDGRANDTAALLLDRNSAPPSVT